MASLTELRALPPNWDGYGAKPINPHCLLIAKSLAAPLIHAGFNPQFVPTSDGDVQIEWHNDGLDIEITVSVTACDIFKALAARQRPADAEMRAALSGDRADLYENS